MERKLKKTAAAVSLAMVVAILTGLLILNGRPERFAYALNMSNLSWGTDVTDAKLNEKNGTPYGTGKGRLVCTTYVSWAVHTHYKVKRYPSGGVVSAHKSWLDTNARTVCSISSPGQYKKNSDKIKPGDIVAFNTKNGFGGTWIHIAIVGGDGRSLHHAINKGVAYQYTVEGWLGKAADTTKQASSCKVYRLLVPPDGYMDMTKKVSEEASLVKELSNYSLSGAKYDVYKEKKGKSVHTFSINANGKTTKWKTKPGTYYVKESKAPRHFKLDATWHTVTVKGGETASFTASDKPIFTRGSLLLKKKAADKEKYLQDAVYEVGYYDNDEGNTNGSPKRTWEVRTDANGCADLAGNLISGTPFKDSKKNIVLPFGTYTYREKSAPEGYKLDDKIYRVKQTDDVRYNVREASDEKLPPQIKTFATDVSTGSNILSDSKEAKVIDRVEYNNLEKGEEYKIRGYMIDKKTGRPLEINGKRVEAEKTFKAANISGTEELEYKLDSTSLKDRTLVIFEELFKDDVKIVSHTDIDDQNQTLFVPEIETSAAGEKTEEHMTEYSQTAKIIDRVTYKNLVPGKEYTVSGTLMDADGGEAVLTEKGEKITNSLTFTPEESAGSVDIEFTIDSRLLAGKTVVIFEKCYFKDIQISAHEDLKDSGQTVVIPNLKTTAIDGYTGNHIGRNTENGKLIDTVKYHNLIPGKEYTVSGVLMDKETGKAVLRETGEPVTASKKFTAESGEGKVEMEFTFDSKLLAGKCVVAFEDCFYRDIKVASHSDIQDDEQSVLYPTLETKATDGSKKHKNILPAKKAVINDEVRYSNLIPDKQYEIEGVVVDRRTGAPIKNAKGKEVRSSVGFTPKNSAGSTDVVFKFDAAGMQPGDCVIFEELRHGGKTVAEHKDINNAEQTVTILRKTSNNTFRKNSHVPKKGKGKPMNSVNTGDSSPLRKLIAIFVSAQMLLLVILRKRYRNTKEES